MVTRIWIQAMMPRGESVRSGPPKAGSIWRTAPSGDFTRDPKPCAGPEAHGNANVRSVALKATPAQTRASPSPRTQRASLPPSPPLLIGFSGGIPSMMRIHSEFNRDNLAAQGMRPNSGRIVVTSFVKVPRRRRNRTRSRVRVQVEHVFAAWEGRRARGQHRSWANVCVVDDEGMDLQEGDALTEGCASPRSRRITSGRSGPVWMRRGCHRGRPLMPASCSPRWVISGGDRCAAPATPTCPTARRSEKYPGPGARYGRRVPSVYLDG